MNTNESPSAETSSILLPDSMEAASDTFASADTAKPSDSEKPLSPAQKNRPSLVILWMVVLALAIALGWTWQDSKKRDLEWQTHTAQRLVVLEEAHKEQAARERQYESRLQLIQEKTAALEWRVSEWQTHRQALEKLYRQLLPLRDEVTMREVEYRIRFAIQQLAMSGNVSTALAALQDADAELTALNRLDLATVKTTLAQAIEALQRTPAFDMRGFLVRFDQAMNTVDQMMSREIPVAMPETKMAVDETASRWKRFWIETKETMLSMVRLRVGGEDSASRLRVTDAAHDRQELRLRLLSLRWMALSRQPMAGVEATAVRDWLTQHFAENDPAVQTMQSLLEELASSPVVMSLPEVSPVLEALRRWRAEQAVTGTDDINGL